MDNLNESLKEAVSIEEEVFFGPITDREKKVKEQFENAFKNENKLAESLLNVDNDISRNDSLYKSFSATESKYESFDDSLNEELQQAQETKHITLRKSFDKLKSKKHGFYDSLEDVCSLVSNMDKCSISCEVEDPSNLNNKQHIIEDSLKNPSAAVVNKSSGVNEQIHFDDDSLAILELENTFDDSLEEINDVCVQSIEFEEMEDIENMTVENQNIAIKVEPTTVCVPRNLFDTSVQIVYEKKWVNDQESSSDDKNMLYDSLSNSDLKDILKDSLEESEKCSENLKFLKPSLGTTYADIQKAKRMFASQDNVDASVLIIHESFPNDYQIRNDCDMKNLEINEFSKDGLEIFKNVTKKPVRQITKTVNENDSFPSSVFCNENAMSQKCPENTSANASDKATQPDYNINKDNELMEGTSIFIEPEIPVSAIGNSNLKETCIVDSCQLKLLNDNTTTQKVPKNTSTYASENAVNPDSNVQYKKLMEGTSIVTDPDYTIGNSNLKEACSIDSCQLKLSNDNMDIDKDFKSQMKVEVTVEDKKCQIVSQDVQVLPEIGVQSKKCETDISSENSKEYHSEDHSNEKEVLDISNSKECNPIEKNIVYEEEATSKNVCENSKIMNATTITHRTKSCGSQLISDLEGKFNFPEDLSNVSLLQALDLHEVSESFLGESFIQSNNSLMPLNLCCKEQDVCTLISRDEEIKENVPQSLPTKKKQFSTSSKKANPACISKTPKHFQNSPGFKDPSKKTPGTKIPVRKIENFVVPVATSNKPVKQVTTAMSAEKVRKCHSPHSAGKKTPGTTPNKTPHFCKVRNTIFSKVPQIVPSKKYMNIQSPVAQYIKNVNGSVKTPRFDPVLRDCMNPQVDSPFHSHQTPKGGTWKSTMKKP